MIVVTYYFSHLTLILSFTLCICTQASSNIKGQDQTYSHGEKKKIWKKQKTIYILRHQTSRRLTARTAGRICRRRHFGFKGAELATSPSSW